MAEDPKDSRTNRFKSLKADSIIETKELLRKLELIYHDLHNMPEEEIEKIWPQTSSTKAPKNIKKTEKEFVVSMLLEAYNNIRTQEFFKKRGIDLNDEATRKIIERQVAVHTVGFN